jgi:hypothetical protein
VLHRALDMVDAPALNAKDRPGGVILTNALSLGWLQDALDMFHRAFPFAGTVLSTTISIPVTTGEVAAPADFILDVRNGITLPSPTTQRLRRVGLQEFIRQQMQDTSTSTPAIYMVTGPTTLIKCYPVPPAAQSATLWYYALPAELSPNDKPNFPADWTLIEYVRLRGLEWLRALPGDTAYQYANREIGKLRAGGLLGESEDQRIPFDTGQFKRAAGQDLWSWMGDPIVR